MAGRAASVGIVTGLITPEYTALNAALHASADFGSGGEKWAPFVNELIGEYACDDVLDYGCGKGKLRNALRIGIKEYDPAIPGKDDEPEAADLVVCTDVLEHIEPECLNGVLDHLRRLTKKVALLNIATSPAFKTLSDGRNAHLIVETAEWWKERLSLYFNVQRWDVAEHGVLVVARPIALIGEIAAAAAVGEEACFENVKANLPKVAKRIVERTEPRSEPAILVCYGPSLNETWPLILVESASTKGPVISVSGAHDFLVGKGIVPAYHVECDARAHKAAMVTPQANTQYLLGSCVHPELVDKLEDFNVSLWHVNTGEQSFRILTEHEPDQIMVCGGGSVGLRAMSVLWIMGYRKFLIHGMDCSFADDQHAGPHTGKRQHEIQVRCGERWFKSSLVLVTYARHFLEAMQLFPPNIEVELHGDGLLQQMCRLGMSQPKSN
jgi:hypothetical protein